MKDAIIVGLLVVIALLAAGQRRGPEAQIEDVSAGLHRAVARSLLAAPIQTNPGPPALLVAPCPLAPRNFPRMTERKA